MRAFLPRVGITLGTASLAMLASCGGGATTAPGTAPASTAPVPGPATTAASSSLPDEGPSGSTTTTTTVATTVSGPETTTAVAAATTFREADAADPLLIWVIGDSLAGTLGYAMRDLAEATGAAEVVVDNEDGSGLVRPDFFHWPIFVSERMPEVQPEVVVVHIGANDGQALRTPDAYLEPGTPEWIERYDREVGD